MARHILDSSEIVRGLRVADVGAGSGIASIAAVMAGAAHVLAVDVDPLAAAAIAINADANDVAATIETTTEDCLAGLPDKVCASISHFFEAAAQSGHQRAAAVMERCAQLAAELVPLDLQLAHLDLGAFLDLKDDLDG